MSNIVNQLELSVRTANILKNMGDVHTLDDFLALDEGHVKRQRGAGRRVWQEIRSIQTDMRRQMREAEENRAAQPVAEDWTKRDEIALAVLPTVASIFTTATPLAGKTPEQTLATVAYSIADAMLAARKTKEDDR